ncbi:hypothetical protein [Bacillus vallismortis]|uniref:hypothetical protein n=1 Tax=Bacillus vallismortis TaxID=72361 RepID=UPI00227E06E0|nr:hypothetical protein [Bacillus vallismortis]MCY8598976.1 hypothetical protein [Bacillus vallismortis]
MITLNPSQQQQIIKRMTEFGERGVKSNGKDLEALGGMATLLWMMSVLQIDSSFLKEGAE